jgi:hypothetical protein
MGTTTSPDALYKPDDLEDGYATLVNANVDKQQGHMSDSDLTKRIHVTTEPVPKVYVSKSSSAHSNTSPRRGELWTPYTDLEQILKEITNPGTYTPSPLIRNVAGSYAQVIIEIMPGPTTAYPTIPATGYPTSQVFTGEAHLLTASYQVPSFVSLIGHGQDVNPTFSNPATYSTLIYANIPSSTADAILRIGDSTAQKSTTGCEWRDFAITNIAPDGRGISFVVGPHMRVFGLGIYGCGGHGIYGKGSRTDQLTFEYVDAAANGNGSSGGYNLFITTSPTQAIRFSRCRFIKGGSGEIYAKGLATDSSGGDMVFDSCRIGANGVYLYCVKGWHFRGGYGESGSAPINITTITGNGTTATVAMTDPHNYQVGQQVQIGSNAPFNGIYLVASVIDDHTWTFASAVNTTQAGGHVQNAAPLFTLDSDDGTTTSDQTRWCKDVTIDHMKNHGVNDKVVSRGLLLWVKHGKYIQYKRAYIHLGASAFGDTSPLAWFDDNNCQDSMAEFSSVLVDSTTVEQAQSADAINWIHVGHPTNYAVVR